MNKLIVLVGPCAVGKDTMQGEIEKIDYTVVRPHCTPSREHVWFQKCVSHTTRPMRDGEVEGENYYFTNNGVFLEMYMNDKFAVTPKKYRPDKDNPDLIYWYGITREELSLTTSNRVIVVDLFGAKQLKKVYKDQVVVIYMDADEQTRVERAKKRGDFNEKDWIVRAEFDKQMHKEACESGIIDYWVLNYDLDKALLEIREFVLI